MWGGGELVHVFIHHVTLVWLVDNMIAKYTLKPCHLHNRIEPDISKSSLSEFPGVAFAETIKFCVIYIFTDYLLTDFKLSSLLNKINIF